MTADAAGYRCSFGGDGYVGSGVSGSPLILSPIELTPSMAVATADPSVARIVRALRRGDRRMESEKRMIIYIPAWKILMQGRKQSVDHQLAAFEMGLDGNGVAATFDAEGRHDRVGAQLRRASWNHDRSPELQMWQASKAVAML